MAGLTSEMDGATGRVTKSHDDNFGGGHAIINQIGIRMREEPTDIRTRGCTPSRRMLL
jgi:hypothetical protein